MSPISLAFVDDHPVLLEGIINVFKSRPEFRVVATGVSAPDAVMIASTHRPDMIVIDLNMPGDAFDAIAQIKALQIKVVAFTASVDVDAAIRALEAGASGYVVKGVTSQELISGIQVVLAGENYIAPVFEEKVRAALKDSKTRRLASEAISFSKREHQIVRLLISGKTNKEIAIQLQLKEKTIKHYMTIVMSKLNARNRVQAMMTAQKLNIEEPDSPPWTLKH